LIPEAEGKKTEKTGSPNVHSFWQEGKQELFQLHRLLGGGELGFLLRGKRITHHPGLAKGLESGQVKKKKEKKRKGRYDICIKRRRTPPDRIQQLIILPGTGWWEGNGRGYNLLSKNQLLGGESRGGRHVLWGGPKQRIRRYEQWGPQYLEEKQEKKKT